MNANEVLHDGSIGDLAYWDTIGGGLIPCKVIDIPAAGCGRWHSGGSVVVRLTATRGAWKRGEVIRSNASGVIPRGMVQFKKNGFAIVDVRYSWGVEK